MLGMLQWLAIMNTWEPLNQHALNLAQAGQYSQALKLWQQALTLSPQNPTLLLNMGVTLKRLGQLTDAQIAYQQALVLTPNDPLLWNNLGTVRLALKDIPAAIVAYQRALAIAPSADHWNNLGNAYAQVPDYSQAMACFRQAIQLQPNHLEARNNWGTAVAHQDKFAQARDILERLTLQVPDYPKPHRNLARVYAMLGDTAKTVACLQRYLELVPSDENVFSNLLFYLLAMPNWSRGSMNQWLEIWRQRFVWPLYQPQQTYPHPRVPHKKLRLGYVSGDMYQHSASHNFRWLFADHDRTQFEVVAYYNNSYHDEVTTQLQRQSDQWHEVADWTDEALDTQIRQDQIDILIDLSGHTEANRLLVFARHPAPLQITGIGFGQSTGLPMIDYRFSDAWIDPPDTLPLSAEQLVYLPCMMHWAPSSEIASPLKPPPITRPGQVVLGCGNNLFKITEEAIVLWSYILQQLPEAVLHLKSTHTGILDVQEYTHQRFVRYGIGSERLIFSGTTPAAAHLDYYSSLDIALDPFPYNGGISTLDALWMGTPVVTLSGNTTVGAAMLHFAGADELIAHSLPEYAEIVIRLAQDPERIRHYRQTLRQQMLASPLLDRQGFVKAVEAVYRIIWQKWCRGEAPAAFSMALSVGRQTP